jgi:hypothetical protein
MTMESIYTNGLGHCAVMPALVAGIHVLKAEQ